jgi:iron complex outermembrane receptor protein
MTSKTSSVRSTALALAIAGVLSSAAYAETTSTLEEIVVTAERRAQNLQEVPISATVLNAQALADQGVDNVAELQQVAPSLAINTFNRSTFINIRGVGIAQSAPTSSPGVAFYLDGALIPHEFMIGQSFYDLAAVEVLRGPQGTLTGQNSTGGAVYVRTPDPVFDKWSGYLDVTAGDYSWTRFVGAVNIPLGSMVAIRLAAVKDDRDSFYTNISTKSSAQPGNIDFRGYRAAVTIKPTDALKINLRYEDYLNDTFHNGIKNRFDAVTNAPYTIEEDAQSYFLQDGYRTSGELTYDFTSMRVRWLTSYQDGFTEDLSDGDRTDTAPPLVANQGRLGYGKTTIKTLIHEANLLSTGSDRFNWVVGAFYLDESVDVTLRRITTSTTVLPPPPYTGNPAPTLALADNNSKSVFGQTGIKFADAWEVIVGARYSKDEQVYDRARAVPGTNVGIAESSQVTGRAALNWTPAQDLLLYTSLSKGYKAGGVNLGATDPNFLPEQNNVLELGTKTTVMDGHLRVNGDVFYSQYKDFQLISLRGTPPLPFTQNAAEGKSYGLELEMQGAFGNFEFNAGLAYLNAQFSKTIQLNLAERVDPRIPPASLPPGHVSNTVRNTLTTVSDGQVMPFSPEITANFGLQYRFAIGEGKLTPRLQYAYTATQRSTPFKPSDYVYGDITTVPSRSIVDARIIYDPNDALRLEVFATNLTDKTYIASQIQDSSTAFGGIVYGAPRQVGLRAAYNFK